MPHWTAENWINFTIAITGLVAAVRGIKGNRTNATRLDATDSKLAQNHAATANRIDTLAVSAGVPIPPRNPVATAPFIR